jgi:hypothetical protein
MTQLDLFAALRQPLALEPVDPHGPVVQGQPDITLRLPHPRMAWDLAAIQLHEHEDGRWMWGVTQAGGGYKVGPKWGKFAATQAEAQHHAAAELVDWCDRNAGRAHSMAITPAQLAQIRAWAEALL